MYVRSKSFRNKDGSTRTYLQLVKGERVGGKIRQRVVANLGRLEDLKEGKLDELIEALARFSAREWIISRAKELEATSARVWGPVLIFRRLWEELGISGLVSRALDATSIESDFEEAAFAMVLNRLCDPMSKLAMTEWMRDVYRPEWEGLELHHFYRALDFLADHKDEIETGLYRRSVDLFNLDVDLVLWDTTTTYFHGQACESLARYGFSKDKRPDRVQIMIGVMLTRDGFPMGHEVFPGDTAEVETFRVALDKAKRQFNLRRVILVADRGMVSEELLKEIEQAGLEYIVGVRMRKAKAAREVLSRAGRYSIVAENLQVKEVMHEGTRYIVCFNPVEAEHDRAAREAMVAALRERLSSGSSKSLIGNHGYRRYVKMEGAKLSINEDAVKAEERYDGKYVLRTNARLTPADVATSYKSLWQVERAFRELKSGLDLRPIYHYTEKRIRGHIMVCFLALVLEMALRRKLGAITEEAVPYDDLLHHLEQVKAVEINLDGKRYLARTELVGHADLAFRALGTRPPLRVTELPRRQNDPGEECCGTRDSYATKPNDDEVSQK